MDVESKQMLQYTEQEHKLKISREEILKKLIDGKDVIEAEESAE